jgi:hypothetical protein
MAINERTISTARGVKLSMVQAFSDGKTRGEVDDRMGISLWLRVRYPAFWAGIRGLAIPGARCTVCGAIGAAPMGGARAHPVAPTPMGP